LNSVRAGAFQLSHTPHQNALADKFERVAFSAATRVQSISVRRCHTPTPGMEPDSLDMNIIVGLAVVLLILWVVLKVALLVTSGLLHLLWIGAVVMLVIWAIGKLRGSKSV
jgi:hypothetical protein